MKDERTYFESRQLFFVNSDTNTIHFSPMGINCTNHEWVMNEYGITHEESNKNVRGHITEGEICIFDGIPERYSERCDQVLCEHAGILALNANLINRAILFCKGATPDEFNTKWQRGPVVLVAIVNEKKEVTFYTTGNSSAVLQKYFK